MALAVARARSPPRSVWKSITLRWPCASPARVAPRPSASVARPGASKRRARAFTGSHAPFCAPRTRNRAMGANSSWASRASKCCAWRALSYGAAGGHSTGGGAASAVQAAPPASGMPWPAPATMAPAPPAAMASKPAPAASARRARRLEPMLFQLAVQRGAAHAQQARGVADIAPHLRQGGSDGVAFERIERERGGIGHWRRGRCRAAGCERRKQAKVFHLMGCRLRQDHGALACMPQRPHVAGPVMRLQRFGHAGRQWHAEPLVLARIVVEIMREQRRDVGAARTQRRYADDDGIEPEQQVGAKDLRIIQLRFIEIG